MNEIVAKLIREKRSLIIPAWIKALRSGKYKQGKLALRRPQKDSEDLWCCLGVLCDIVHKECNYGTWTQAPKAPHHAKDGKWYLNFEHQDAPAYLTQEIMHGLDITHQAQTFLVNGNDSGKMNFNNIADYVESEFKKLKQ